MRLRMVTATVAASECTLGPVRDRTPIDAVPCILWFLYIENTFTGIKLFKWLYSFSP